MRDDEDRDDEDLDQTDEAGESEEELGAPAPEGASGVLGFAGGLVLGALIGAGLALLVAPERGTQLRRRLVRGIRDAREDFRDELDDLRDAARRRLSRRRRRRRLRRGVGRVVS